MGPAASQGMSTNAHSYIRNLYRKRDYREAKLVARDLCNYTISARLPHDKRTVLTFHWQDDDVLQRLADMGPFLGALPIETVHEVLHQVDLATLARLQRVSRGMKRAVGSLPKLRAIIDLAPDVVPAIIATGTGSELVCNALYDKLCDPGCDGCDGQRPGPYLYLLAGHRVCHTCLVGKQRYRPLRPMEVAAQMSLHPSVVRGLPAMVVPRYTMPRVQARLSRFIGMRGGVRKLCNTTGWRLIDREAALRAGLCRWGSQEDVARNEKETVGTLLAGGDGCGYVRFAGKSPQYLSQWSRARQLQFHNPSRIEASMSSVVKMPWLDGRSGRVADAAVYCAACRAVNVRRSRHFYPLGGEQEHEQIYGRIVNGLHVIES